MNKKLKLVLSIFCLCISFGFVAFAVYAATSTNYALSNTISYQIEDVYVRIQTKLYKKSTVGLVSQSDLNSQASSLEGKKHSEITGLTLVATYDEFSTYNGKIAVEPKTTGCDCDIAYSTSSTSPAFAYYIVLEIENYASEPIHAILTNNTTADINSYIYSSETINISGKSITSMVIGFALKDSTIALASTSAPFVLKINNGEFVNASGVFNLLDNSTLKVQKSYANAAEIASTTVYDNDVGGYLGFYNFEAEKINDDYSLIEISLASEYSQAIEKGAVGAMAYIVKGNYSSPMEAIGATNSDKSLLLDLLDIKSLVGGTNISFVEDLKFSIFFGVIDANDNIIEIDFTLSISLGSPVFTVLDNSTFEPVAYHGNFMTWTGTFTDENNAMLFCNFSANCEGFNCLTIDVTYPTVDGTILVREGNYATLDELAGEGSGSDYFSSVLCVSFSGSEITDSYKIYFEDLQTLNFGVFVRDDNGSVTVKLSLSNEQFNEFEYELKQDDQGDNYYEITGYTPVVRSPKKLIIPNSYTDPSTGITASVKSIGANAFEDTYSFNTLIIPETIISIGENAFDNCDGLTSVVISKSVTSIANYAFFDCSCLTTVNYTGTKEQWDNIDIAYYAGLSGFTINYNYVNN